MGYRYDTLGRLGYVLHDDADKEAVIYGYDAGGQVDHVQGVEAPYMDKE